MRHDEALRPSVGEDVTEVLLTGRCHQDHDLVLWCRHGRLQARAGQEQHVVGAGAALHIAAGTSHDVRVPPGGLVHPVFLPAQPRPRQHPPGAHQRGVDRRLAAALLALHVSQVTELRPADGGLHRLTAEASRALLHAMPGDDPRTQEPLTEPPRSLVQWVVNPPEERVTLLACFGAASVQVRDGAGTALTLHLAEGMALDIAGGVEHRILTDGGVVLPSFHPGSPTHDDLARLYYLGPAVRLVLARQLVARTSALRPDGWDEYRLTRALATARQQVAVLKPGGQTVGAAESLLAGVIAAPGTSRCPAAEADGTRGRRSLERDVQQLTGESFVSWRNHARCEQGMDLIVRGMSVQQVARRMGYAHASAFSRTFRQCVGLPPALACAELLATGGPA